MSDLLRRFSVDAGDHGFIEIMYELAEGVRLNNALYVLDDQESYFSIVEALKKFSDAKRKLYDPTSQEILDALHERLQKSDFSSYKKVFEILQLAEKIYDAILYMKAYHFYGIPSCGYRYFNKDNKDELTNRRPLVETKQAITDDGVDDTAEAHSTANVNRNALAAEKPHVYIAAAIKHLDELYSEHSGAIDLSAKDVSQELQDMVESDERAGIKAYSEHQILFAKSDIDELQKRIIISLSQRLKKMRKDPKDSVHFLDYIRTSTPAENDEADPDSQDASKRSTMRGSIFSAFKKVDHAVNILWGKKEKCTYSGCSGKYLKRSWIRNVYLSETYCPPCMSKFIDEQVAIENKERKRNGEPILDATNLSIYNIEGGDSLFEFLVGGGEKRLHLRDAYKTGNRYTKVVKEIEKILKKVEEGAAAGSETDKPKIIRRVISKETKKYCVLCSSPELRDIETGVFDHFLSPFPNNDEYMEEIKFCCNDINDELSSLRAQKIKMFKDSITTDELMVHLKEHKSKRKKIHLFDKFKPGHDIRKRLVVCNHFKGSSSSLTPRVGDVVTVKVGDEVDSQEGIVIKKIDVKKEDSDMSDDSDSDDSSILDSPDHEYLVAFTNRESEVFDSGSIRPYRSTVISNVKSVFQEFYADIKKNPGELPDPEGEQDITFGGHHEKTYYMSKKQFCLALTNGLTMLRKKDWSFSCHKKYLEFLHDTMYELECIYMTKPLCEEIHKEIRNMKSEKITIHGLGKLGALLNETPPNLTILRQVLSRADLDNDGMLSLSDFVRFSGRPLLEQYSNTMQYGREKKATEKGGGMPSLLLAVTQTQDKDTDRNDSLTYQQFPETQAEILVRLRRSYGTYVPTSKTSVLFSLTDAQRFATGLKQILVDEDKSEQFILDFQHKFDMHSDMSPGVITNRKKALYARCKALGVMYGWCHPSVWEYEHNLELYQEMARAQMEMESRGRVG